MHDDVAAGAGDRATADDKPLQLVLADEAATLALGAALAPTLFPGLIVFLEGDLGAGKTTLVRGLLNALGHKGKVKSPTYTLVELYSASGLNFYHFDFYRFNEPEEYLEAGLDEYFRGNAICMVEWPAQAGPYLPGPDLRIRLEVQGAARRAEIGATTARARTCLETLKKSCSSGATCSNSPVR